MDGEHFDPATGEVTVAASMPPAIAAAIITVKKQVKMLGGDERNEHAKYTYVSVDKFYDRIGKLMAEAGLALLIDETATDVRGSEKSGSPWLFAQYSLAFIHESGAMSGWLRRSIALPINGPQTYGAAQSYIEKQFLRQVFKVPTGDRDADGTEQGEDAPARAAGGRTAQEAPRGGQGFPARQQAAPPPSEARADAERRYKLIRSEIDACMTIPAPQGLDGIVGSPPWVAMVGAVEAAEKQERADELVEGLLRRIANRRDMLESRREEKY